MSGQNKSTNKIHRPQTVQTYTSKLIRPNLFVYTSKLIRPNLYVQTYTS